MKECTDKFLDNYLKYSPDINIGMYLDMKAIGELSNTILSNRNNPLFDEIIAVEEFLNKRGEINMLGSELFKNNKALLIGLVRGNLINKGVVITIHDTSEIVDLFLDILLTKSINYLTVTNVKTDLKTRNVIVSEDKLINTIFEVVISAMMQVICNKAQEQKSLQFTLEGDVIHKIARLDNALNNYVPRTMEIAVRYFNDKLPNAKACSIPYQQKRQSFIDSLFNSVSENNKEKGIKATTMDREQFLDKVREETEFRLKLIDSRVVNNFVSTVINKYLDLYVGNYGNDLEYANKEKDICELSKMTQEYLYKSGLNVNHNTIENIIISFYNVLYTNSISSVYLNKYFITVDGNNNYYADNISIYRYYGLVLGNKIICSYIFFDGTKKSFKIIKGTIEGIGEDFMIIGKTDSRKVYHKDIINIEKEALKEDKKVYPNTLNHVSQQIKDKDILAGDYVQFITKDETFYTKCMVNKINKTWIEFCCLNGKDERKIFYFDNILLITKIKSYAEKFSTQKKNIIQENDVKEGDIIIVSGFVNNTPYSKKYKYIGMSENVGFIKIKELDGSYPFSFDINLDTIISIQKIDSIKTNYHNDLKVNSDECKIIDSNGKNVLQQIKEQNIIEGDCVNIVSVNINGYYIICNIGEQFIRCMDKYDNSIIFNINKIIKITK